MRVVIAGGGTGGHLFPGIALAREIQRRVPDSEILFVGTARGLESRLIPKEGFPLSLIPIGGLVGQGIMKKLRTLFQLPRGVWRSFMILKSFRPQLVIGVGGYASGPLLAAAGLLRLPRALVEPNAVPGVTNRILAPWVHRIYVAFEETRGRFGRGCASRVRAYGNPVRREIVAAGKAEGAGRRLTLLVMGGSQGSKAINRAVEEALGDMGDWKEKLDIIHQTGEPDVSRLEARYAHLGFHADVASFLSPVSEAYRRADLVLGRAGATTVAELTACGRPAVFIPYPHATHGHQEKNARALERAGAAAVILEKDLTGAGLARILGDLLGDPRRLKEMAERSRALGRPEAAERIVSDCLEWTGA